MLHCFTITCKEKVNSTAAKIELEEESEQNEVDESFSNSDVNDFQKKLQGMWKRVDYPYSTYIFKESTAKQISEGMPEDPQFIPYELADNCRFADEANAELATDQMILTYQKYESCELISVKNDTLRIGAFDGSYEIVHTKQ